MSKLRDIALLLSTSNAFVLNVAVAAAVVERIMTGSRLNLFHQVILLL